MAGLTDAKVRAAKASDKTRRLFDGGGLYLEITTAGGRYWRLKYRHGGKEKRLALGVYPEVSLADARQGRDEARMTIRAGEDPSAAKQAAKRRAVLTTGNTFESIAREWLGLQTRSMAKSTHKKALANLERMVFPWIGALPITEISPPDVLALLRRIEARGAHETAHRAKARCSQVFRFAIATGRATRDPTVDLRGALAPIVTTNFSSITDPARVGELLRAIDGYSGQHATRCALKLAPLVFVRPGELRRAAWSEFNLSAAEWRIPASRMKMGEEHVVPLAKQALAILRELKPLTAKGSCYSLASGHRSSR